MTDTATPTRLSSSELLGRLDALERANRLRFNPGPLLVYKPSQRGNGNALKVELRVVPIFSDEGYSRRPKGGLFFVWATQTGFDDNKNATFGWDADAGSTTAKMGLTDLSKLLLSHDYVRGLTPRPIPESMRPKKGAVDGSCLSLFHKSESANSVIEWEFGATSSILKISQKTGEVVSRKSISLDLAEELLFVAYLRLAVEAFFSAGMR